MECKTIKWEKQGINYYGIEINLPKTNVFIVGNDNAYFMCGILDVHLFDTPAMATKHVICGKAVGVSSLEELRKAKLVSVSKSAEAEGIYVGMIVEDALLKSACK